MRRGPSHWLPRRPVGVAIGYTVHGTIAWETIRRRRRNAHGEVRVTDQPSRPDTVAELAAQVWAVLPPRATVVVKHSRLNGKVSHRVAGRLPRGGSRRARARAERHARTAVDTLNARHPDRLVRPYTGVLPLDGDPFTVATDGSCRHRGLMTGQHPAGWAFITGAGVAHAGRQLSGPRDAELEAACQAIGFYPPGAEITIMIDNLDVGRLVQECAEQAADGVGMRPFTTDQRLRWVSPAVHQRMYDLVATRTVHARWVKAHRGHMLNELANDLARDVAIRYDRMLNPARSRRDRAGVADQHAEPVPAGGDHDG